MNLQRNFIKSLILVNFVTIFSGAFCKSNREIPFTDLILFGERVRKLCFLLFNHTDQETGRHVVMAPYTIWYLISLVAFRTSEDSWSQLHSTMGISRRKGQYFNTIYQHINNLMARKNTGSSFKTKCIVFYDTNLQLSQDFQKSIAESGALLRMLDFDDHISSTELANDDMQLSNSSISAKRMVFDTSDFEETSMIVSGVVEFRGTWEKPFDGANRNSYRNIFTMRQIGEFYQTDIESLGASVLELPYKHDSEFSMLIIRPHNGYAIKDILVNLANVSLADIFQILYSEGLKEVEVELPKFSLSSLLVLNGPLMSMGIVDVFEQDEANFSGISLDSLYIVNVEQRVTMTVSEEGTVATAYTPGNLLNSAETSSIRTSSPFLFFVVHGPSLSVIFCGKYE